MRIQQIKQLLEACTVDERKEILEYLRSEFPIHPLEETLGARAEIILEAISRSSDLTQRGVRGVIAEAAFDTYIVSQLHDWEKLTVYGDPPYDFLLKDISGEIRIQVKMQRLRNHQPMRASQGYKWLPPDMYVVEVQRTRGGIDLQTGENTRPYRFGEFDILAVSLHPSTRDWSSFLYTVANWLLPRSEDQRLMLKFQPVPQEPNESWTDQLETCIRWLRAGEVRRIL